VSEKLKSSVALDPDHPFSEAIAIEICPELSVAAIDPVEIYRFLGYPQAVTPAPRMADHIAQIVTEAQPCLRPRGAYAVYAVSSQTAHSLQLADTIISGKIGEYLKQADRIADFAVTVGKEISHLSESAAKNGDTFSAWVMDTLGSWAVERAADAMMLHIRRHLHEGQELTLRYSPGYCGIDIRQQRKLFHLVPANCVGVTLMPSMLMHPLKSISGLVGLAPKEAVSRYRSPCDFCPRTGCHMRR
jgi:cobalamin-dependent methionine synthase I